jgi:hypothetical protein
MIGLIAHEPGRSGAAGGRRGGGAAARKDASAAQPLPPAVAAAMIPVEVVRPASAQKAKGAAAPGSKTAAAGR